MDTIAELFSRNILGKEHTDEELRKIVQRLREKRRQFALEEEAKAAAKAEEREAKAAAKAKERERKTAAKAAEREATAAAKAARRPQRKPPKPRRGPLASAIRGSLISNKRSPQARAMLKKIPQH